MEKSQDLVSVNPIKTAIIENVDAYIRSEQPIMSDLSNSEYLNQKFSKGHSFCEKEKVDEAKVDILCNDVNYNS